MGPLPEAGLKIGMVTRHFPPGACGGTGYNFYHIGKRLVRMGHRVTVYTRKLDESPEEEWMDGIHVKRFSCFEIPVGEGHETSCALLRSIMRDDLDLLHLITLGLMGQTARLAAFFKRIPYFITIPDIFTVEEIALQHNLGPIKRLMFSLWESAAKKPTLNGARDLFGSQEVINRLQEFNLKKVPLYLGAGADIEQIDSAGETFKEKYGFNNKKVLLCVGGICERKSQITLVKSLPELLEAFPELVCVFPSHIWEEEYYQKCLGEVESRGLESHVLFLKGIEDEELVDIYKSSDIFVFPSIYEGFGAVIVEAWAARKPVIAGDSIEIVTDMVNGVKFATGNPSDLAKKISLVLSDKELTKKLIENGRKEVEEEYSWDKIAKKIESYYIKGIERKLRS